MPADEQRQAIAEFLSMTVQDLWELIHHQAPPTTVEGLQAEVAALRLDVADLRASLTKVADTLNAKL